MTGAELRAIIERHRNPRLPAEHRECPSALDALHADLGAALDLLRRVAKMRLIDGGGFCPFCDAYVSTGRHDEADCPALALEALR